MAYLADGVRVIVEKLNALETVRRLSDANDCTFELTQGALQVDEFPADGVLRADNGVRFAWQSTGTLRRGCWVQLSVAVGAESAEDTVDPRAAFCDDEIGEVWTQPRSHRESTIKVKKVDRERYQLLLERFPSDGEKLFLPVNVRNLQLQQRALRQLKDGPLPHHRGLLQLCEDPSRTRWPRATPTTLSEWYSLTDLSRDGTQEQRIFVEKALGTPDFAFLEGPPGSGKTTAICELVQQLVLQNKRVLLCGSTHVAIDNVLERLIGGPVEIDAVRIGKVDRVDPNVKRCQLDEKIDAMLHGWSGQPAFVGHTAATLRAMAERTVIAAANLTCATTMGIAGHPLFRDYDDDLNPWERPIANAPHWDVLIIDEASKTLTQEFLVPAMMAKRWVIVGDVRQLPPFAERADIKANLGCLVDEKDDEIFTADHQRAMLLLFRLRRQGLAKSGARWLVVEPPGVLEWIAAELEANGPPAFSVVRVVASRSTRKQNAVQPVSVEALERGDVTALQLLGADVVLVEDELLKRVASRLPAHLLAHRDLSRDVLLGEKAPWLFRQAAWKAKNPELLSPLSERGKRISSKSECEANEQRWLNEHDLPGEIAWRITRIHELRYQHDTSETERIDDELERLLPKIKPIDDQIMEIEAIGLPSILEVLQEGIGAERTQNPSALTEGFVQSQRAAFEERFEKLTFQHRMHPELSKFSRAHFYQDTALRDANTITSRDLVVQWDYHGFSHRRVWLDVEDGDEKSGVNAREVAAMRGVLKDVIEWATLKGPPNGRKAWEIACLSFYSKQERAISEMLQQITGDSRHTRFEVDGVPVEIVCGTVDRFQGREADMVLLSLRNTHRIGFLDSPNRLNVALTRARQQLVVVGRHSYYRACKVSELEQLALHTEKLSAQTTRSSK